MLNNLSYKLVALHDDVSEMKTVLRELTNAITKLALIEQQQAQTTKAQERAFVALEKVEARVSDIERRLPEVTRTSIWVDRAVWSAAAVMVIFLLKKIGLV